MLTLKMNKTIDRISSLPDDVLKRILPFTSTKEAVHTCILAKRWRNIWASVPVLDFNLDDFYKRNDGQEDENSDSCGGGVSDDDDEEQEDDCDRFVCFVNGVLENREPSHVDIVRYNWIYDYSDDPSSGFLDRITLLMPRIIIADIDTESSLPVPDSVFSCASLLELILHLYTNNVLKIYLDPKSINLPYLKTLELHCVEIGDDFARNLFSGCLALESIKLDRCYLHILVISSSVLKMLTLDYCTQFQSLRISCPALVSLLIRVDDFLDVSISLLNMTSLVNADITILDYEHSLHLSTLNLLSGLSNTTSIKLRVHISELKEHLEEDILNGTLFNNLKSLEIAAGDVINCFGLVACYLKNCPNLQELTLRIINSRIDTREEPIKEFVGDLLFQLEYLETLKIICWKKEFAGSLVKLLMRYIKTIGNIIVDTQAYWEYYR